MGFFMALTAGASSDGSQWLWLRELHEMGFHDYEQLHTGPT